MTIVPATIAPLLQLPHLPLAEVKALPSIAAVYFVVERPGVVVYVGRTRNLAQRWRSHHRAAQLDPARTFILWYPVGTIDEAQFARLERVCIRRFAPRLNDTPMERKPVVDDRPFVDTLKRQAARLNAQIAACNEAQSRIAAAEQGVSQDMERAIRWLRAEHQRLVALADHREALHTQTRAALQRLRKQG